MKSTLVLRIVAGACAGAFTIAIAGCELMVQLDRSAVDAGEAGCDICSDASFEEGGEDAGPDARDAATDRDADAKSEDAGAEASTRDAPAGGG